MDTTNAVSCNTFAKPNLDYSVETNASCPIGPGNCANGDDQALILTAPNLDSHEDLGINAPKADRVQYGYRMPCAPVAHDLLQTYIVNST